MKYIRTRTKISKKDRRESGRKYFEGDYYDEYGHKIHYTITQWDNWEDYRDGLRNPIGIWSKLYDKHPPSWKHITRKKKQYKESKLRYFRGFKR